MDLSGDRPLLRIGELSLRLGVSGHVLRAWESRYGLPQPVRSAGGFRLYSEADEMRVRRMQAHLAGGLSAAEAARTVLREDKDDGVGLAPSAVPDLARPAGPQTSRGLWGPDLAPPAVPDLARPAGPRPRRVHGE